MPQPRQVERPPIVEIPTGAVRLEAPGHLADWPRRAEAVPNLAGRAAHARATGAWVGEPLRLRQQGPGYVLVAGFARLAVAVEAGLATVRAVVEPPVRYLPRAVIHLRPWQERARLSPRKLARRREQVQKSGILPALVVRPARLEEPEGYTLLDGLYWYRIAQELALAEVPVVVQEKVRSELMPDHRSPIADTR